MSTNNLRSNFIFKENARSDHWIITDRNYRFHHALADAEAEMKRLQDKTPAKTFRIHRLKGHLEPSESKRIIAEQKATIERLSKTLDDIFTSVSYVNVHGVGEQSEPTGLPRPVRVKPDEFWQLFQNIGKMAISALEAE